MQNYLKLTRAVLVGILAAVAIGWWLTGRGAPVRPLRSSSGAVVSGSARRLPASPAVAPGAAAPTAAAPTAAAPGVAGRPAGRPATPIRDPATTATASIETKGAAEAAATFARALFAVSPGKGRAAVVARCQRLVTPGFLAQLATSPGAPSMAAVAAPVVVTGVSTAVEDWSPGAAGVAVGVSLHAGAHGPASFVGLDLHLVAAGGTWLVDGMEM